MNFVKGYIDKIGYSKSPMEYLLENKGFVKEKNHSFQVSTAAILLFGKNYSYISQERAYDLFVMREFECGALR